MSESFLIHNYTVVSHIYNKFLSKINVSNSFKSLPTSESNAFFLWFETEINQIYSEHLYTARVDKTQKEFFIFRPPAPSAPPTQFFFFFCYSTFQRMGPGCPGDHFKMTPTF